MRVMCCENKKIGSLTTMEITDIGFDEDITNVKNENGEYDRFQDVLVSGLLMRDCGQTIIYIPGVSMDKCNEICKEILRTGFYDLTECGEYEVYDSE